MNRITGFLMLVFAMLLAPGRGVAQQFNNEGMTYQVLSEEAATVMIYKAHRCVQHFAVPYQVKDYTEHLYRVTEIEYDAFRNLDCLYVLDLGGVQVLRDGYVQVYEDGAQDYYGTFANCRNIEEVNFRGLTHVGDFAFSGCRKLTHLQLSKVEIVGKGAFRKCTALETVVLGTAVRKVLDEAFAEDTQLKYLRVESQTPPVCAENAFAPIVYENVVLYVPSGEISAYRQADGWKNFVQIEEMPTTGIGHTVADPVQVKVGSGYVVVDGTVKGEQIRVYDSSGRLVVSSVAQGETLSLRLEPGRTYWLKVGKQRISGVRP